LVQALLRVDLNHHVFDVVRLHELMNHHVPEDPQRRRCEFGPDGLRAGRAGWALILYLHRYFSFTLFNFLYNI